MRYNYHRRPTHEVKAGPLGIGGCNPVRIQSMANTNTNDVEESARQAKRIADAGGELVRFTTQGVREARSLGQITARMRELGCRVPVSADVHFNPKAAFEAALTADKVRINPGNFVDAARTFRKLEFSDEEYAEEIRKIERAFVPFLTLCKERGVSIRLGVNHGSLSDRIMSRYGDTPAGMVESVMEFLEICMRENFKDVVISIKASNTSVMVATVKLLVDRMNSRGMTFPLHLGVTEAGDAEDGRIKSAVGIGALLAEGIGDTIRVSLSEPPEMEIPVAAALRDYIAARRNHAPIENVNDPLPGVSRDRSVKINGFENKIIAMHADKVNETFIHVDASQKIADPGSDDPILITSNHINAPAEIMSYIDRFQRAGFKNPFIISLDYKDTEIDALRLKAAADFGFLLLNGYGNGIQVSDVNMEPETLAELELGILQAARLRVSKTEYIACPSCGRTLFDLPKTLRQVKEATKNMKGLKIGVMGCIVNGPGEMADADYGYVGAGPGRVSIYKGKELIQKNVPAEEALTALISLIRMDRPEIF